VLTVDSVDGHLPFLAASHCSSSVLLKTVIGCYLANKILSFSLSLSAARPLEKKRKWDSITRSHQHLFGTTFVAGSASTSPLQDLSTGLQMPTPARSISPSYLDGLIHRSTSVKSRSHQLASQCRTLPATSASSSIADSASLLSAERRVCTVPRQNSTFGDRSFASAGPRAWNELPFSLRDTGLLLTTFNAHLKTYTYSPQCLRPRRICDIYDFYAPHINVLTYLPTSCR